jgi:hypothetical protein
MKLIVLALAAVKVSADDYMINCSDPTYQTVPCFADSDSYCCSTDGITANNGVNVCTSTGNAYETFSCGTESCMYDDGGLAYCGQS